MKSQGWLILAEALLGHGDRAFEYFKENAPSMQNDRAEIRKIEPYCYGEGVGVVGRVHEDGAVVGIQPVIDAVHGQLGLFPVRQAADDRPALGIEPQVGLRGAGTLVFWMRSSPLPIGMRAPYTNI